jgi:hypothetical protein
MSASIVYRHGLQSAEQALIVVQMERPIEVELPHRLGREEARRRIEANVHKLADNIPGGASHVEHRWAGDDLHLKIHAMGQALDARIGVEEAKVTVRMILPGLLGMFAKPFEAMLNAKGSDLLLDDKRKG